MMSLRMADLSSIAFSRNQHTDEPSLIIVYLSPFFFHFQVGPMVMLDDVKVSGATHELIEKEVKALLQVRAYEL